MDELRRPYYLESLIDALNRALFYRGASTYAAQNRSNTGELIHDIANNKIICGNLAFLVLQLEDKSYCVEWGFWTLDLV